MTNDGVHKKTKIVYVFEFLSILLNLFCQLSVHCPGGLQTCTAMISLTDTQIPSQHSTDR